MLQIPDMTLSDMIVVQHSHSCQPSTQVCTPAIHHLPFWRDFKLQRLYDTSILSSLGLNWFLAAKQQLYILESDWLTDSLTQWLTHSPLRLLYLKHITVISQVYFGYNSGILQIYFRHTLNKSQAYLSHVLVISKIHLGCYQLDLGYISSISQAYLRHISSVYPVYIRYFLSISLEYLINISDISHTNLRNISRIYLAFLSLMYPWDILGIYIMYLKYCHTRLHLGF